MALKETLQEIIIEHQNLPLMDIVPRDIAIERIPRKATTLIGIRRCGKTTVMLQREKEILSQGIDRKAICFIDFSDDRLIELRDGQPGIVADAYYSLYPEMENQKVFFFFDEIENLNYWEHFVNRLMNTRQCEINITGSSAKLLEREVSTVMGGRKISWHLYPYSFAEYLRAENIDSSMPSSEGGRALLLKAFTDYMKTGGFPESLMFSPQNLTRYLQDTANDIAFRDIIERYKVTNAIAVKTMMTILAGQMSSKLSITKLYQRLRGMQIKTTKEFGESTVSKILDLVENASSRKSRSEDFISKFARIYTPAVCIGALLLAILPPVVRIAVGLDATWESWIYRALTFLVISCPCALVISIPLSFFAGLGGSSNAGILVKGSNYMETLSKTKIVVFDKTGTLTQGVFEVNRIHHNTIENEKIIEYAALAESSSSHPIAKSLQKEYGREIDRTRVSDVQEISGKGIIATVDGHTVACGNEGLMEYLSIRSIPCHSIGTIVHVAIDGAYTGHIVISDVVKPNAAEAIRKLRAAGIRKTVMLTGDRKATAEKIAKELGIEEVYSELLPSDKVEKVENILKAKSNDEKLAFVGDGINDAPVLGRADIGIAMGAMGSDAAIEAADVVLMDDDPLKIAKAIRISQKCMRIVYENIVFAIGVKALCLILGAVGIANMWLAIFADVGVMVLAVLNAIRALFVKKL